MKLASVVAAFPVVGLALTSTVPVRVDAVFPRNNTVYQPLYPFPIVFAIHNFDKVWNSQPSIVWWLYRLDGDRLPGDTKPSAIDNGEIAWDNSRLQDTWAPPPSMFLAINYTKHLQDAVPSRHSLRIQYNVGKLDCPPRLLFDEIFFSITNITTSDTMPDVKSFSGCPRPLGNFDVGIPPESNWTCSTTPVAEVSKLPCLFSGDQRTFDDVANKMVNVSGCLGATWPGGPNTTLPRGGIACKSGVPVKPSEGSQMRYSSAAIGLIFLSMGLAFVTAG
jgi:hypothetical protein